MPKKKHRECPDGEYPDGPRLDRIGPCEAAFLAKFPQPLNPNEPGDVAAWEMMRDGEAFVDWAEEKYRKMGLRDAQ